MEIIHVSAECFPVAKAGGLGDVVGALPKYQNKLGHLAKVVMPMHKTSFLYNNEFEVVHKGAFGMGPYYFNYTIIKEKNNVLGFDLYMVDIFSLLDREKVYGYHDDTERFVAFQIAVVDWLNSWQHQPDIVHVHDHHTALIPFMMQYCYAYQRLAMIKTVLTIHNAQYQGWMDWSLLHYIPARDSWKQGLLDWDDKINPLASGIRCAARVTTVSQGYLEELQFSANGLENLFNYERGKCYGIINGIDTDVWNPKTDSHLTMNYNVTSATKGKAKNKKDICKEFNLDDKKPLIVFIGRLVGEKAADVLPYAISESIVQTDGAVNFLVLGSGDPNVEEQLHQLNSVFVGYYNSRIGYNEALSHKMYAAADFLLMPSRVEPCGLNQMYAMRYGTIPMVRRTGGLKDTVQDFGEENGFGICFNQASEWDITHSVNRALDLYDNTKRLKELRERVMKIDHSWENSAQEYINLYLN
jgi:starch synthase